MKTCEEVVGEGRLSLCLDKDDFKHILKFSDTLKWRVECLVKVVGCKQGGGLCKYIKLYK